ncbi:MAG: circadian clock protein KaiB [Gammaproteobacteria bacterium SHHR-1]|uniref:circadian clock KaiB family protein n=1 Tax=Magnetovirga frankeli TaxID=947516 RepID=UPI0012932268|nr:circadian clock protein KaiB [gamma proteobacterium SS-5]
MKKYLLCLYIIGDNPLSKRALSNLQEICSEPLFDATYEVKVIDLLKHPQLAEDEKILATPVLIRHFPEPMRRIIGDLSNTSEVLVGLDLTPCNP